MKFDILRNLIKDPQIYRFLTVSITINLMSLFFIAGITSIFGVFYAYSVLISLEVFSIVSFFIHDRWTFSIIPNSKRLQRFIKFNVFALSGFALNESILLFLTTEIGIHYLISESIAIVITFFFNFIINKKVTWKN